MLKPLLRPELRNTSTSLLRLRGPSSITYVSPICIRTFFTMKSVMLKTGNLHPSAGFYRGFENTKSHLLSPQIRLVSTKQRRRWKIRKYHFKLRLKRTMRKMRVPYMSSKSRGQVKKKPILYDFRPYLRRKLKRAER